MIIVFFTKSKIQELSISNIGNPIIIILSRDSQICEFVHLPKFAKSKTLRLLPDLQYTDLKIAFSIIILCFVGSGSST